MGNGDGGQVGEWAWASSESRGRFAPLRALDDLFPLRSAPRIWAGWRAYTHRGLRPMLSVTAFDWIPFGRTGAFESLSVLRCPVVTAITRTRIPGFTRHAMDSWRANRSPGRRLTVSPLGTQLTLQPISSAGRRVDESRTSNMTSPVRKACGSARKTPDASAGFAISATRLSFFSHRSDNLAAGHR